MSILQIIFLIFIIFVLARILIRFKQNIISFREWLGWTFFWVVVAVATLLPQTTDIIASNVGLQTGRGVDLIVYISIPLLFYIIFRLFTKVDKIESQLTKIVRRQALLDKEDKE